MHPSRRIRPITLAALAVTLAAALAVAVGADQSQQSAIPIDPDDIGGVVTGPDGPEGGVWVIAETHDFPSRFIRIVVTDEHGRYVVPDLPAADYEIWVRGYGLVDSPKRTSRPGTHVDLTAVSAPNAAAAAHYYPAAYWYSMLDVRGETAHRSVAEQHDVLDALKSNGCVGCHQMGNFATRSIPAELGTFASSEEAWQRRVLSGQAGQGMANQLRQHDGALLRLLADWTDRVAAGELPATQPVRPYGVERNVVVTVRDWSDGKAYMHDLISTDRRNPTVNAYGPLFGAPELSTDLMPILDPVHNVPTTFELPVRDVDTPTTAETAPAAPSAYWGDEVIWDSQANVHNPMFDADGRLWLTARVRGPQNPAFCREGSDHPSATLFPTNTSGRHLSIYDPATQEYTFVDTCFSTHHLQFDANDVLWTSGGGQVVGWLDSRKFLATGDAATSQGWTAFIVDTNGNGRRDEYVEPDEPVDPARDKRFSLGLYAVMPNPADGSIWGSNRSFPGTLVRVDPGANPPATALTEVYDVPLPGFGIRGADIDRDGVVWASLSSGHLGSFDRRKCRGPLSGPAATGDHCPEGWEFYQFPGPGFEGFPDNSVESSYYTWVDQWNTLGLGENVPIATGNLFDGFHALVYGRYVTLRVPYPMGFYAKGHDGRIDDPDAGWKGRGLWSTNGDRVPWHMEGGKGTKPLVVHFQVRPDPLAR
jgi:hypothetical protein